MYNIQFHLNRYCYFDIPLIVYCFSHQGEIQIDDHEEALRQCRQGNRLSDDAPQRIFINRFENDLENDLLAMYKTLAFRL